VEYFGQNLVRKRIDGAYGITKGIGLGEEQMKVLDERIQVLCLWT
jgi:hypothetical protein